MMKKTSGTQRKHQETLPAQIEEAAEFFREGKLDEARVLCQAILESQPKHIDALHLLGVLHAQTNQYEKGINYL